MRSVSLLDCTLRDGGYVNDWNFGNGNLTSIFNHLCKSKVEIIEIGFLDDRRAFDKHRTIQPDTAAMTNAFQNVSSDHPMVVAMIDYGTCSINNIQPKEETFIDGIRIIFKKAKIDGALEFAKLIMDKGYKVFLQMVSITSYDDSDLQHFISKANEIHPYAVSIVDTYGLLNKDTLIHYYDVLDRNLTENIIIGYHSHNNFQLGFSNSVELIEHTSDRNILVDGTLYGMGKSAGNAPLELLADYLNQRCGKNYEISSILEAIDNNIMNIYLQKPWGYSYIFYISALNDCHPNYVTDLLEKNTLSVKSIQEILSQIPNEKKLLYDGPFLEELYRKYQGTVIDDKDTISVLKKILANKEILLLGPGRSLYEGMNTISEFIHSKNPIIVSVNHVPDSFDTDYIFISNSKRYNLGYDEFGKYSEKTIATSNISPLSTKFAFTVNYDSLRYSSERDLGDNSLLLMLSLLNKIKVRKVFLAGFDGFTGDFKKDYCDERVALRDHGDAQAFNEKTSSEIRYFRNYMDIVFVTKSKYE